MVNIILVMNMNVKTFVNVINDIVQLNEHKIYMVCNKSLFTNNGR